MEAFGLCILFASCVNIEGRAQANQTDKWIEKMGKMASTKWQRKKMEENGIEDMSTREAIESVGMCIL